LQSALYDGATNEDELGEVVRVKRFSVQPMWPEEAIEQMELLGHSFYVFYNAGEEQLNVLYRRTDGNYGLLQPEFS
jgi:putative sigma-54 modulation protein